MINIEYDNLTTSNKVVTIIDKYNRIIDGVNHGRKVTYDSVSNIYYKFFHPDYIRRENFEVAISKFYDEDMIPALKGLIYDKGLLIGYYMEGGIPLTKSSHIPQQLQSKLLEKIDTTKMFYYDLDPSNVIQLKDGRYSLIDLESVYTLSDGDLMVKHNAVIKPGGYKKFIEQRMKTNVVFMANIDLGNGRNDSYKYSINSWQKWCDKNDCILVVWEDLIYPIEYMPITWQRYYVMDILEANKINYDQILMVDCDTIIHPECPNMFNLTGRKYCGVINDGSYEWVQRSIRNFGDLLFEGQRIHPWEYINGGFQIFNEIHKPFFDHMKLYYNENKESIEQSIAQIKAGTDQTILNFKLKEQQVDVRMLPPCYNLQDLAKKDLLYIHPNCWWEDTLENLLTSGWIFHFNALPQNPMNRDANYWLKRVYDEIYET